MDQIIVLYQLNIFILIMSGVYALKKYILKYQGLGDIVSATYSKGSGKKYIHVHRANDKANEAKY